MSKILKTYIIRAHSDELSPHTAYVASLDQGDDAQPFSENVSDALRFNDRKAAETALATLEASPNVAVFEVMEGVTLEVTQG